MLYYEDIKLRRRRRYVQERRAIYALGAKPLGEPLTRSKPGDALQRRHKNGKPSSVGAN